MNVLCQNSRLYRTNFAKPMWFFLHILTVDFPLRSTTVTAYKPETSFTLMFFWNEWEFRVADLACFSLPPLNPDIEFFEKATFRGHDQEINIIMYSESNNNWYLSPWKSNKNLFKFDLFALI